MTVLLAGWDEVFRPVVVVVEEEEIGAEWEWRVEGSSSSDQSASLLQGTKMGGYVSFDL